MTQKLSQDGTKNGVEDAGGRYVKKVEEFITKQYHLSAEAQAVIKQSTSIRTHEKRIKMKVEENKKSKSLGRKKI